MKTSKDYHDHYMKSDVLLLSDCFENFRQTMISAHGLDCMYFPSLPSLALQIALKMTRAELDLITDANQYLLLESSIRGGLSYVAHRHAKANNPSLPDFDPELPTTCKFVICDQADERAARWQFPLPNSGRNRKFRRDVDSRRQSDWLHRRMRSFLSPTASRESLCIPAVPTARRR